MKRLNIAVLFVCWLFIPLQVGFSQTATILTLEDAIEIALEKSYEMKVLKLSVIQARENLIAARGRFRTRAFMNFDLPDYREQLSGIQQGYGFTVYNTRGLQRFQGNLFIEQPLPTDGVVRLRSSAYHLSESFLTLTGTDTTTRRASTSLSLEFDQPLFTINRLKYGLKTAQLRFDRANRYFSRMELNIIYDVTQQFYNLYRATREREIAAMKAQLQEDAADLAQKKYDAGLIPEVEVLQMEVDLADSRSRLLQASGALKRQADNFKQLIGLELDENIAIRTDFQFESFEIDSAKAIEEGLKQRSEIRETEISLELAKMSVKEVDSRWEISGELSAFYDLSGISASELTDTGVSSLFNSSITDLRNRPRNKGVVFTLTVPLWDWGVNRAEVAAARASVTETELALTELRKTIVREIRAAINQVKEAENQLEVLKMSEERAEKSYQINTQRFENGDITSQELALDQERLTQARLAYLNAFIAYKLAIADLTRKTMYDFEKGVSLVRE